MTDGLIGWVKRRLCGHNYFCAGLGTLPEGFQPMTDYTVIREETLGVTLGWAAEPEVLTRALCRCQRCGGEFWSKPGYLPYRHLTKPPRDERGWPLNADGTRMPIADA